jgi:hypothetical protein
MGTIGGGAGLMRMGSPYFLRLLIYSEGVRFMLIKNALLKFERDAKPEEVASPSIVKISNFPDLISETI